MFQMTNPVTPSYHTGFPSDQAAVDIFKGLWKSAFPPESGVEAGTASNFEDSRVGWVDRKSGGLRGRSVLELGPYEAYITHQLAQFGSAPIIAIEGNRINYLKCLIAKEILGIDARFMHGDIQLFMETTTDRFDLCWATGVLYHQVEPLMLLRSIARVCSRVFIWTHFYDEKIAADADGYPHFDPSLNVEKELDGFRCMHYYRSYLVKSDKTPAYFSGGSDSHAYWLTKDDIIGFVKRLGFTDVAVVGIGLDHPAGPTMSFLAARPRTDSHLRGLLRRLLPFARTPEPVGRNPVSRT